MSVDLMNDTFDNFTFSAIQNLSNYEKCPTTNNCNENKTSQAPGSNNIEISFDDSLFFNTPEFSIPNLITADSLTNLSPKENDSFRTNLDTPFTKTEGNPQEITINRLTSPREDSKASPKCNHKAKTTPNHITQPSNNLLLSTWGLPPSVLQKYKSNNIKTMFQWQVDCLSNPKVLYDCANLVYSAPTSAGKTLISEILTIKTVIERKKKVIFILPFVSVVREKMFYFQEILSSSGVRVEGFMGSYNPPGGFQSVQVAICTIEKANSLINKLLQENNLSDIGAVIIDEMHLLGDPSRGYLLELLLTKLKYITKRDEKVKIQIIGMSATLPNLDALAKWLEAELFVTTFRPIPLSEQAHVCGEIYDNNLKLIRCLKPLPNLETDTDNILQLCLETIQDSCSVLIFCPTKNWCENLAQQIAMAFWKLGNTQSELSHQLRQQLKPDLIGEVLQQFKYCPVGLDDVLKRTVSFGVAFHHAGLTMDERDIIESAFRNCTIRVLVATSTLSSGVNLPARRVIIRTPIFHGKPLDTLSYRQMIGRAGRMGKDTAGESILVCQKNDYKTAKALMTDDLAPIESCLEGDGKLKRALLEVVASGVATSPADVALFTSCTLLAQSEAFSDPIDAALDFLVKNEFIRLRDDDGEKSYRATSLGRACLSSSIAPEEGLALFTELEKARQCFVLETELHLIYLVTPYSACHQWGTLDWMFYLNLWEKLPRSMRKVGELVGVSEAYIVNATRGKIQTNTSKLHHRLLVHKRFFVSLALQDLVNEKTLADVCAKFSCNRGMLQSLQLSAATFAGMVTAFSRQLGWSSVEILISQFQDRLHFGVSRDLLDLMRMPILNGKSARALFNAGLETLVQLANSDVATIESILHKVVPFETNNVRDGETEFGLKERNKFRNIWITGREGLTENEAAELLLTTARNFLVMEMGLKEAKWDKTQEFKTPEVRLSQENHDLSADQAKHDDLSASLSDHQTNLSDSRKINSSLSLSGMSDLNLSNSSANLCSVSDRSLFEDSLSFESKPKINNSGLTLRTSLGSLNSSSDLIATSQDESYVTFGENLRSLRKRPRKDLVNDRFLLAHQSPLKKKKLVKVAKKVRENKENDQFEVINVCSNVTLFNTFFKEIRREKCFALAVACSEVEESKAVIGPNQQQVDVVGLVHGNRKVDGFAIAIKKDMVVYYLDPAKMKKTIDLLSSLTRDSNKKIRIFDSKEQIKVLKLCCGVDFNAQIEDPKVAEWILEPECKEKNLQAMVQTYLPEFNELIKLSGSCKGVGSVSLNLHSAISSKQRSCVEALTTFSLIEPLKKRLTVLNPQLLRAYETEMATQVILAKMEVNGLKTNPNALSKLTDSITAHQSNLEKKAFSLAGKRFSLASSREVAKILGMAPRGSTKKQVLEKVENPISELVVQWRKLSCIVTKTVQPLVRSIEPDGRIRGCCVWQTSTGRISMHEPNLQNVAKDFDFVDPLSGRKSVLSCRDAFGAEVENVLVSADYCQLELRLLAHLSQDQLLCGSMRKKGDVFKAIASEWNGVPELEVTEEMRHNTKHICYGIIYGMGSKTLAGQLQVEETEAEAFMETFRNKYPGVKKYIQNVIEACRRNGYVETIAKRRRYLPHINDSNLALKTQAERQAVNTTIQGSAADLVKRAMVDFEKRCIGFRWTPKMVLHLHDELIYEVSRSDFERFSLILRIAMEGSVSLSIPFPVKIKWGPTWGQFTELKHDLSK